MTLPEQAIKRRRQILDDETGDAHRFNASAYQDIWAPEHSWVKDFIARLAGLTNPKHQQQEVRLPALLQQPRTPASPGSVRLLVQAFILIRGAAGFGPRLRRG